MRSFSYSTVYGLIVFASLAIAPATFGTPQDNFRHEQLKTDTKHSVSLEDNLY